MAEPGELTPAERIDAGRATVRSLKLLLKAIDDADVVATPLEVARPPRCHRGPWRDRRRTSRQERLGSIPWLVSQLLASGRLAVAPPVRWHPTTAP
jgi:hypothetical protein